MLRRESVLSHLVQIDDWIHVEISSRKNTKVRRIDELFNILKRGDRLIVSELSRLARSIREAQTINNKKYYRHPWDRGCKKLNYIPADLIENAVLAQLFEVFGDRVKIMEAAKQAIPDLREVNKLRKQSDRNQQELKKIRISKDRLLDKVEKGIIEDEDLRERWNKIKDREVLLKSEIEQIQSKLRSVPTEEDISRAAQIMLRVQESYLQSEAHLKEMSFEDKRALSQNLFGGTDKDGNRYGVYVEKMKRKDLWVYTIKLAFLEEVGRLESGNKLVKQNMQGNYQLSH